MAAREAPIRVPKEAVQLLPRDRQQAVAELVREGLMILVDRQKVTA